MFPRAELLYTRCYCEENIYQLCRWVKETKENLLDQLTVVFISNPLRRIPIWEQSSSVEGNVLIWDYHVILIHFKEEMDESLIYDFDTRLAFPTPMKEYIWLSFRPDVLLNEQFERYFRLIPAKDFLSHFASDRSHMLRDGEYIMPPPTYNAISTSAEKMNLDTYIDMIENRRSEKFGVVLHESEFFKML